MANNRQTNGDPRDTKTGDFTRRPDLDELGGSSSEGISEAASGGANMPADDPWVEAIDDEALKPKTEQSDSDRPTPR